MRQESTHKGIGQRLREVRGNLSQAEFADQLGVVSKTIRRYESDETVPDGNFLLKLEELFQADPAWILLGKYNASTDASTASAELSLSLTLLKEFRFALDNTIANLEKGKG